MKKMMMELLLGSTLLAGCVDPLTQISTANGDATLQLKPQVVAGGLMTQGVVNNYTKNSINHLVVKVFTVNGAMETPVLGADSQQVTRDILKANLDNDILFTKLNANTTYRIRSFAYKVEGEEEKDLISTSDASSYVDVTLLSNDRPTIASLRVKLIDIIFDGQATASGVTVTNGGYSSTGPVTVQ